jgi:hypothetical protein
MLWNKQAYFLVDYAKDDALVLITKTKEIDPSLNWVGDLVIKAYDLTKLHGSYFYITPIIGPLEDDTLESNIPQLS